MTLSGETDPFTDLVLDGDGPTKTQYPGSVGTYQIGFSNNGTRPALGVTLNELFPDGGTILSASISQGTVAFTSDGNFVARFGTVAPEGGVEVIFRVAFTKMTGPSFLAESLLTSLTPDVVPDTNALALTTPISTSAPAPVGSSISMSGTVTPGPVHPGNQVTYRLDIANVGTTAAEGTVLFFVVPGDSTLISATSIYQPQIITDPGPVGGGLVAAYFGEILPLSDAFLIVTVKVSNHAGGGTLVSQAIARSDDLSDNGPESYLDQRVAVD